MLKGRALRTFKALSEAAIPYEGESAFLKGATTDEFILRFQRFISDFPPVVTFLLKITLLTLEFVPIFTKFKTFSKLPVDERIRYMQRWLKSRNYIKRHITLLLKGFAGVIFVGLPGVLEDAGIYNSNCLHGRD